MRVIFLLWISFCIVVARKYKKHLLFTIMPGETTCFVKNIMSDKIIEVVYKVVYSSGSPALISFDLQAPRRARSVVCTRRWPAGAHVLQAAAAGAYRFCFDNNFDKLGKKTINFHINIRSLSKKKLNSIHSDVMIINLNENDDDLSALAEEGDDSGMSGFKAMTSQLLRQYQDIDLDELKSRAAQVNCDGSDVLLRQKKVLIGQGTLCNLEEAMQ